MTYSVIIRNVLLAAGVVAALTLSTYRLSESPGIWYDEGFYTQIGMNFAQLGEQALQTAPGIYAPTSYITVGFPLILPLSLSYTLFDVGVLQGRAVMVLFLWGFIAFSYLVIHRLFGSWNAALTLVLLASFPMLYGNGKAVLGEIPGLFFLMVSLLALINLEKTQFREWRGYVFVGLTAGLCAVTKPFFLLFLGALGITLLIKWRSISLNWSGVAAGIVALLVPVVVWVFLQFGNDTSLSHILSDYANPYSVDLATQVLENTKRLVTETTPLYTLLLIVVWSVSLLIRKKKDISSAEIAGYVFSILAILSYLRLEGWYRYLFPATTIALVFFPAALQNIYTYVSTRLTQLTQLSWLPLAVILALSLGQFYESTVTSYVAQSYTSTRTRDVAQAFSVIDPNKTLYFYNTPELIIFSPSKNYYQYLSPLPKVIIGEDSLSSLKSGVVDMVFVHSDVFEQNSSLFESYKLSETIDRYILLQRK